LESESRGDSGSLNKGRVKGKKKSGEDPRVAEGKKKKRKNFRKKLKGEGDGGIL